MCLSPNVISSSQSHTCLSIPRRIRNCKNFMTSTITPFEKNNCREKLNVNALSTVFKRCLNDILKVTGPDTMIFIFWLLLLLRICTSSRLGLSFIWDKLREIHFNFDVLSIFL